MAPTGVTIENELEKLARRLARLTIVKTGQRRIRPTCLYGQTLKHRRPSAAKRRTHSESRLSASKCIRILDCIYARLAVRVKLQVSCPNLPFFASIRPPITVRTSKRRSPKHPPPPPPPPMSDVRDASLRESNAIRPANCLGSWSFSGDAAAEPVNRAQQRATG
jgi:hypothetical protein